MIKVIEAFLLSLSGGFLILADSQRPEVAVFSLIICAILGCILSWYLDKDWHMKRNLKQGIFSLILSAIGGFVVWHVCKTTWLTYSAVGAISFLSNFLQIKKSGRE